MHIGVIYPQTEFGSHPNAIRDYAQAVEAGGLDFIEAYDHILGANPQRPGGWRGPYTHESLFVEPFLLFTHMAAFTTRIEFATNIIILPQRQTALVAKQAATLDVLCGGRFRLGVGLGWNEVEYLALNENFHNRGKRLEEQIAVLRELFTKPLVTFEGRWHHIPDAGLNPMPVQRPIPIWLGGREDRVLDRVARLGDGWMTNFRSVQDAKPYFERFHGALDEQKRSRDKCPVEARISYGDGNPDTWRVWMKEWQALGATYISLNTMGAGFKSAAEHIRAVTKFAQAILK